MFRRPVALMYFMIAKIEKSSTSPETLSTGHSSGQTIWTLSNVMLDRFLRCKAGGGDFRDFIWFVLVQVVV